MKKVTKAKSKMGVSKMSATKKADVKENLKAMSPQDKFKAMIAAKKAGAKGKMGVSKMSYGMKGAMKKGAKKK